VVTVKKGVNDADIADIVRFALNRRCVRGVTFQPVQDAGRNEGFDKNRDRVLLTDIRREIISSGGPFGDADMIPLPCNPESISIGYALRNGRKLTPVTSFFPKDELIAAVPNAVTFEKYPELHKRLFEFFSLSTMQANTAERLEALLCCLPQIPVPAGLSYENVFRVVINEFLDAHNFCISRVKRSCVHFLTPAGQIIPFDTYNLLYRDGRIDERRKAAGVASRSF
ncbi:MAG: radical SAM protein, partial [Gammaproteobacteria bacterium]